MTSKIFVTQENPYDFSGAEQFGEIQFLARGDLANIRESMHNEHLLSDIRQKLNHYDPLVDFILPVGSPFLIAAIFLILGHMGHTEIRVLRWSNRDRIYVPLFIKPYREAPNGSDQQKNGKAHSAKDAARTPHRG